MDTKESDPLDEIESETTDAHEEVPTAMIESEPSATLGPQDDHYYLLTPYCCDGHNDQWLVMGMNSATSGPPYALGPVELMQDQGNPTTTWRTDFWDADTFRLINQASLGYGLATLTAPYDDSPVVMVPEADVDPRSGERKDRCLFRALPVLDGTWYMLQLVENPGVYLNVSGDGPYPAGTLILVYSSPGPEPNQVWRFQEVLNP